jgi:hypothetical protein
MKKIYIILIAACVILSSCGKLLDLYPTNSIASDIALKDSVGIEKALVGSYNALQLTGMYSRYYVIIGDLVADNLQWSGTTGDYGQIDHIPIPADNSLLDEMWYAAYDGINRVNNIIYALPDIQYASETNRNKVMAEALFLRALFHYDMTVYFGDIPLRTVPTLDLSSIEIERSPRTLVFSQIIEDLEFARNNLPSTTVTGRADYYSAAALLAKTYLADFQYNNNIASADSSAKIAERIINSGEFLLEPEYIGLYTPDITSTESIFEVVYDVQNFNRLAQYFYSRELSGRYEVSPTTECIDSYETGDNRKDASIDYDGLNAPYVIKYNDVSGGTDRVYVLRLADMYLTRAEALIYTNGNVTEIQNDINEVRNRAGLDNTTATTIEDLKIALENECRHEFAFEGRRWIDLVRTGRAVSVLGIEDNYTLFPIPLNELLTNKKMTQNPGY